MTSLLPCHHRQALLVLDVLVPLIVVFRLRSHLVFHLQLRCGSLISNALASFPGEHHANLQPDSAAFTVWNVPSLGPNPGLRMMGSVQARWQRDGNHWQLQAKQRLLLEECDR